MAEESVQQDSEGKANVGESVQAIVKSEETGGIEPAQKPAMPVTHVMEIDIDINADENSPYVTNLKREIKELEDIIDELEAMPSNNGCLMLVLPFVISYIILLLWGVSTAALINEVVVSNEIVNVFSSLPEWMRGQAPDPEIGTPIFFYYVREIGAGLVWVNTTTGGVVSALVISVLAATKPGDNPAKIVSDNRYTRQRAWKIKQLDWRIKRMDISYRAFRNEVDRLKVNPFTSKLYMATRDLWAKYLTLRQETEVTLTIMPGSKLVNLIMLDRFAVQNEAAEVMDEQVETDEEENLSKQQQKIVDLYLNLANEFSRHTATQEEVSEAIEDRQAGLLIKDSLIWIYLVGWLFFGFSALVVGVMIAPEANETLAAVGTNWLGIAVASAFSYFGIDPDIAQGNVQRLSDSDG